MTIEQGKAAPSFTLKNADGNKVALHDFKGRNVILYFYPKDDTPGCIKEACGFRDLWSEIEAQSAVVLGVSSESSESHRKFAQKYNLPFTLLSDPDKKVMEKFGAWGEKNMYGKKSMGIKRSTFVIDADGKVTRALYGVKPDGHAELVLEEVPT